MSIAERARERLKAADRAGAQLDTRPRSRAISLPTDPLQALARFAVTDDQVEAMEATRIVWGGRLAVSHLAAWVSPANGGKTTIAKHAAGELARDNFRVWFFQEDASAGDLPALHEHAKENGYQLLNSTLAGASPDEQLEILRAIARADTDLAGCVFFFDTLKKFADLMSKGGTRGFFQLMRALTQRGATVVLLGHTNKHRGPDGKLIFEGVGDVRNDVDELIYIEATEKDAQGMVTLTMRPDKVRCAIGESSFRLNTKTMQLDALEQVVDVQAIKAAQDQRREDQPVIEAIDAILANGGMNHTELIRRARDETGMSRLRVERIFERYVSSDPAAPGALWSQTRGLANARYIARMPGRSQ